jgi:phosphoribosylanthranilate isomerase
VGKIKICGLKSAEMMQVALEAGADYVGLVFFEKSPRNVSLEQAAALASQARGKAKIVALVVNADNMSFGRIKAAIHPDYFQLHGDETQERVREIKTRFQTPLIKALGVREAKDIVPFSQAAFTLLDAKPPLGAKLPGGNGVTFDWNLLKKLDLPRRTMLSGGLTELNVREAILTSQLSAVDVSSGVESSAGVKDEIKIRAFIQAARQAFKELK